MNFFILVLYELFYNSFLLYYVNIEGLPGTIKSHKSLLGRKTFFLTLKKKKRINISKARNNILLFLKVNYISFI